QAYAASLVGAVVVAIALAAVAVGHVGRLEDARRGIGLRIAAMPEADLLPVAPPGMEIEVTGTLVELSAALTAARTRKELLKALLVERARVEVARTAA